MRHAQQRFYESISGFIQDNPHSAWTQGLQIEMAKDDIQKGAYLAASENLKQVWSDVQQRTPEAPALNGRGGGLAERGSNPQRGACQTPGKGFTKLIRHADEPQMLQSTGNPADSSAYPNADESALGSSSRGGVLGCTRPIGLPCSWRCLGFK